MCFLDAIGDTNNSGDERHVCPHRNKESHLIFGEESLQQDSDLVEATDLRRKKRKQWEISDDPDISASADQKNARQVLADATNRATSITVEGKGNSSSAANWSARQVPKRLPIRPPDQIKLGGDGDFTTIHQMDFVKKPLELVNTTSAAGEYLSGEFRQDSSWKRQIPKTLPIKQPDSLTLSGPISLETTHQKEYNKSVFENKVVDDGEVSHRPRTSLKLAGEFQSDSSYQRAFTPKHGEAGVKVKRGMTRGHLKPEGEMSFDTTSLDYKVALTEQARWESDSNVALKPKPAKPQSGIKISEEPLQDETTAVNDYRRWSVGKPERHKPSDTLQLGYATPEGDGVSGLARNMYSSAEMTSADAKLNEARWHVSRPVVRKPHNNLKPEGDFNFATTNDVDYSIRRDRSRYSQSNLETVSERVEKEPTGQIQSGHQVTRDADQATGMVNDVSQVQSLEPETQNAIQETNGDDIRTEAHAEPFASPVEAVEVNQTVPTEREHEEKPFEMNDGLQNEVEYVTWDQIRPKPVRPYSNLRQEGGMEFHTTNRSDFVEKSSERVKGVRPKTTTKVFEGDFDATTMNQIMFSHDQGERANPIRPKSNLHVENGDFVDETTTAHEYQQWQINRPSPIVHKPSLMQEGSIDFATTNKSEFHEKRLEKVFPIRPSTTNKMSGEHDLITTNQVMLGAFPIERVHKIVPQTNLRTSSGVFNDETTSKTQFHEYPIDRPKPIRPISNLRQEGSMDFTTMNQLQFEEKPFDKVSQFRPQTSTKLIGDFDGMTTNNLMFSAQPMQKLEAIKPKDNLKVDKGIFSNDTTNNAEFQQWQHSKPLAVTPRNNLQQEGSMDFTTNNQLDFAAKSSERVSQIRPKTNPKITGEFDGTTTNRMMYQSVTGDRPKAVRPKTNLKVDKGNFEGETTNTREFQTWGYEKPSPIKPQSSLRQEGNMDFTTVNDLQFEGKAASERAAPIRPTTATKITGDFDGTTTNQVMYQNNPIEKVKGNRPSTNIHLEGGRFENQTTARREFQKWELAKPEPIKYSNNLVQEGNMDFTTSNQLEFGEKHVPKENQIRPHTSSPITGEFDGTTTNQVMYQAQPVDKVQGLKPKDNLRIQSGEMKGETTTSREYGYKAGSKLEAIKPDSNLSQEGDHDFVTSNQLDFDEKNIDRVAAVRPKTLTKTDGKFYGTTTNQAMLQAPAMETLHAFRPNNNIRLNEGTFQSSTTATDAYQQWKLDRPKAFQLASSLKQEGDMSFETTNNSEFKQKNYERVQQIRPKTTSKIEGDFTATTTNQAMYHQPEKLDRVKPIRHENNLHVETGKFSDETTANRAFRQWVKDGNQIAVPKKKLQTAGVRTQKDRPRRRKEIIGASNKSAATDHEPWKLKDEQQTASGMVDGAVADGEISAANAAGSSASQVEMASGNEAQPRTDGDPDPVQGASAVRSDYVSKQATGAVSQENEKDTIQTASQIQQKGAVDESALVVQPQETALVMNSSAMMQDGLADVDTRNMAKNSRSTEKQNKAQNGVSTKRRYKPLDNLKIDSVPFEATSTTRTEYKRLEGRRSSSKRRGEHLKQEGKMEFDTTSNDYSAIKDYKMQKDTSKSKVKKDLGGTLGQTGNMEFSTTSKSSYVGKAGTSRAKNLRPRSSLRLGGEPGSNQDATVSTRSNPEVLSIDQHQELTSTSRASYVGYVTNRRTRANRPSTSQKVGQGAFDGQTTTRSSFPMPQDKVVKQQEVKPENHNIIDAHNGFTGDTTYRSSFESVKGHCPVLDLEAGKLPLTLAEEKNGHVFYAPRVQG